MSEHFYFKVTEAEQKLEREYKEKKAALKALRKEIKALIKDANLSISSKKCMSDREFDNRSSEVRRECERLGVSKSSICWDLMEIL